jgi:hypothetical protein
MMRKLMIWSDFRLNLLLLTVLKVTGELLKMERAAAAYLAG